MAKRILVVDDEAKLLRAVAVTLREEGYEVTTARSGADALVSASASVPEPYFCREGAETAPCSERMLPGGVPLTPS